MKRILQLFIIAAMVFGFNGLTMAAYPDNVYPPDESNEKSVRYDLSNGTHTLTATWGAPNRTKLVIIWTWHPNLGGPLELGRVSGEGKSQDESRFTVTSDYKDGQLLAAYIEDENGTYHQMKVKSRSGQSVVFRHGGDEIEVRIH